MYRLVEIDDHSQAREIAQFESAYAGLEHLRHALLSADEHAARWRLLDPSGAVLVEPADVLETTC